MSDTIKNDVCVIKGYGIFDDGALSHPFADYHKKNRQYINPNTVSCIWGQEYTVDDVVETIGEYVKAGWDESEEPDETDIRDALAGSIFPFIADILNAKNESSGFVAFDSSNLDDDHYAALLYLPSEEKKGTKSQEEVEKIFSDLLVELDWGTWDAGFKELRYDADQADSLGYWQYQS